MTSDHYAPAAPTRTEREAADVIGVTRYWLANQALAGLVPFIQLGRYRRYTAANIDQILADRAVTPADKLARSARSRKGRAA